MRGKLANFARKDFLFNFWTIFDKIGLFTISKPF